MRSTVYEKSRRGRPIIYALFFIFVFWSPLHRGNLGQITSAKAQQAAASFTGALDTFLSGSAGGWALNNSNQAQAVTVRIYLNAPYNQGGLLAGSVTANQPRPDLNKGGIVGDHGYTFSIPKQFLDGQSHSLYVYAVGPGESLVSLSGSPKTAALQCGLSHCPVVPIQSNDGSVKVETVGNAETVFDHTTDACSPKDVPDTAARAFRDASGHVSLLSTEGTVANYRSIGLTLDAVKHSCDVLMRPADNPNYDASTYHEWIDAPYTLDGSTVYSLVHNEWYPTLIDKQCVWGWVNSLTLVTSTDGGAHFSHPPDYKVRVPAVPWSKSFTCTNPFPNDAKYGSFEPTNIVAKERFYYSIFFYQKDPTTGPKIVNGNCLMRTQDLAHGSSWQVWAAQGWAPALTTPHCDFLSPQALSGAYIKSISYNTYLKAYVGLVTAYTAGVGGTGYTLSQDLINWSKPVLFLQNQNVPQGIVAYPSLLDPTDTSRNFEMSGREPYVYLMRWDGSSLNRDLIRQKIRFTKLAP